jgi:HD-GYP domain-containing protein (c-di-GMP phosphodiesterase class II)
MKRGYDMERFTESEKYGRQNKDNSYLDILISNTDGNMETINQAALQNLSYLSEDWAHSEAEYAEMLAENVSSTCSEVFGSSLAWVYRAEVDDSMSLLAHSPPISGFLKTLTTCDDSSLDQEPSSRAIRTGVPVITNDISSDPIFEPCKDTALAGGFSVSAAFPLIKCDKTFGTLYLFNDQQWFFTQQRIKFIRAYTHQAAAALENAQLLEEANRRLNYMQALRSIDKAINTSKDKNVIFNAVLDQVTIQLGVHAADILLFNQQTQTLEYAAGRGFRSNDIERLSLRLGEGYVGNALLEHKLVHITDLPAAGDKFPHAQLLAGDDFIVYQALPLIAKGQVKGVLEIFHRTPIEPKNEWLDFLKNFTDQVAVALDNAALFDSIQSFNADLPPANDAIVEIWLRDKENDDQSQRISEMTLLLARALGLEEDELAHIRRGALLHDIGEIDIPKDIMHKPGKLTNEEFKIMSRHTTRAHEMLSSIEYLRPALAIPYCHHEKWDGTGYPRGLKGEQIPLAARIFAVVDVWDALRSDRPHRPAWNKEKALVYISEQAGKHFDPKVVEVFMEDVLQTSPKKLICMR